MAERALILADDIGVFLSVARSLGRRGIEVHVALGDPEDPGLRSRYVTAAHFLPPYRTDPSAWIDALRSLATAHRFRLIVPCSDSHLRQLDHHQDALGRDLLAVPNPEALAAFTDKSRTRELAAQLAVPIAKGVPIDDTTIADGLVAQLGLPLVLKPCASYGLGDDLAKTPARILRDGAALEAALAEGLAGRWLAEAFFDGEGVGLSVVAREGRILLAWQHRRRRTIFDTGASSVRAGEFPDERLLAHVRALAEATALTGVAMFEFRCNPATSTHVLLEVNPRFWGSLPLALAAGADFPAMLWDVLTGGECPSVAISRPTIVKRSMTGEFDRLTNELEAAPSFAARVRAAAAMILFWPTWLLKSRFDSWAADDAAPFLAERRQLRRRATRALAKRVGRSSEGL
jgi:predicted ATP-grasp superfamily ATP-dependent carboligase